MVTRINIKSVLLGVVLYSLCCNCLLFIQGLYGLLGLFVPLSVAVSLFAGFGNINVKNKRLKWCNHGVVCLKIFRISMMISLIAHILFAVFLLENHWALFLFSILNSFLMLLFIFTIGIVTIYVTSLQLGIKHRVLGIIFGMIPIANYICLGKLIKICEYEVELESYKIELNEKRKSEEVCKTKYPILLVHGVFFRDFKVLNYWGRIPKELESNGATVFYGNHSSALPIEKSALELKKRIEEIVVQTGCEKVNIIAHSKGGLDCRALLDTDACKYIASLTTINTPHKGCEFADYILEKSSEGLQQKVSTAYNFAAMKMGDKNPDFISAVTDLTHSSCSRFNECHCASSSVYTQSFGTVLKGATSSRFPLNLTYRFVKRFDGEHDGLVSVNAFEYGEKFTLIKPTTNRGISHADIIDLNRENIPGFDVREFYVEIVSDLKNRGL